MEQLLKTLRPLALPGRLLTALMYPSQKARAQTESGVQASAAQRDAMKNLFRRFFNDALSGGGRR